MSRALVKSGLALAAALAVAACSSGSSLFDADSKMFTKRFTAFDGPTSIPKTDINLGASGPVAPDDLVAADGGCAPPVAAAPAAPPAPAPAAQPEPAAADEPAGAPPDRPVGSMAGDLAGAPMPIAAAPVRPVSAPVSDRLEPGGPAAPTVPLVTGGIALGMTECQVVRRAGAPSNVSVGANEKGERKVVLSYLQGNWPGIYQFESGRLKTIDAAPVPDKPVKPAPKKHPKKKPAQAARHDIERVYVQ